ncbi:copper homeostasis protein CutC isoform X2 [Pieris brassicae]|uniref:copper homeostasis protein CutC isoform X2 n=1 Tax=Pieris brassicae TaxID=7116 RepID=UPI001E65F912|nr:copper homeostasis protein CutC isoform X2 [Pieris brassicae]
MQTDASLHSFPNPKRFHQQFNSWVNLTGDFGLTNEEIFKKKKVCDVHFTNRDRNRNNRLNALAIPSLHLNGFHGKLPYPSEMVSQEMELNTQLDAGSPEHNIITLSNIYQDKATTSCTIEDINVKSSISGKLEVCVDSLESAINAIDGGADELEICSSLMEGGLTPSPGLVNKVIEVFKFNGICSDAEDGHQTANQHVPKLNIMIRCRGGSDFCYNGMEIQTMLADIRYFKELQINRFVFGALTDNQELDIQNCSLIVLEASPIPVTFHRAFDLCNNPFEAMEKIIQLGFDRVLTSGQRITAIDNDAVKLIKELNEKFGTEIEIMPGSGVNLENVRKFIEIGCKIVHSSCKVKKNIVEVKRDLCMGCSSVYVTDKIIVKSMVEIINK